MTHYFGFKKWFFYVFFALTASTQSFAIAKNPLIQQLKTILNESLSESLTPGAVLLVSSPELGTITVASGLSDKAGKVPMKITNNFRIASMSKTFLAVTVLKLIEQGKLGLNDKIADLLPDSVDIDRIPNGNQVTVKQLLQMRSGIPSYSDYDTYMELIDEMKGKDWTPQDCISIIYDKEPGFAPGKEYEYSNTNYLLLQLIVENLEGGSYADSIRKEILEPLHLKSTFIEMAESDGNYHLTTQGYTLDNDKLTNVTYYNDGFGLGDGGIISTAGDINIFIQSLLKDRTILTPEYFNKMLNFKDDYGLGIWREEINEEWAWSHNGLSSGFQGQYYYFPDRKLTVVLLTNDFDTDIINDVISKTLGAISKSE